MSQRVFMSRPMTAVPVHEVDAYFRERVPMLIKDGRFRSTFEKMLSRREISSRYSCLPPDQILARVLDARTSERMALFKEKASELAMQVVSQYCHEIDLGKVTHLFIGSCTGLHSPFIDLDLIAKLGFSHRVKHRTFGFMGCNAGIPMLEAASEAVRADPSYTVLVLNVELCTLHMHRPENMSDAVGLSQFADGAAAAIVSAEPKGACLEIEECHSYYIPQYAEDLTWRIGDKGFVMTLSKDLPEHFKANLLMQGSRVWDGPERSRPEAWTIHSGGRKIIDAAQSACRLMSRDTADSRAVLRMYGNMSSPSFYFDLQHKFAARKEGNLARVNGIAIAPGPGLSIETMLYSII